MGLDLMTIVRGLESVEHVPGRLERLECGQPFGVFVDHAQTPNTLALSLRTVRQVTEGRVICVYGSPHWQASDQRAAMGSVAERGADVGIITSNDPGREAPLKIAHDILDGFRHPGRAHVIPDRAKAIRWALSEARPGDTVLITGKGDQTYQLIGERAVPFEDRDVARCWLHGSQPRLEKVGTRATIPFRPSHEWN
jgi:UDP-N-acetylmuramoyl-L-alanyl-D-glutamate--2,6-diaminopimelate ligase